MSKIVRLFKLLITDPVIFYQKIKHTLFAGKSGAINIDGIHFNIDLTLGPSMKRMYYGLYEYQLIRLLKQYLQPGDTMLDIGANVGYLSAIALSQVGTTGSVHAFEPVPQFYRRLRALKQDNSAGNLHTNQIALGATPGTATIAVNNRNIGWNTMVPDFMRATTIDEQLTIQVDTLDNYVTTHNLNKIKLIKIDTEGFELPIIQGFETYFNKHPKPSHPDY